MASSREKTSKLFAHEIATYSDKELDKYLEANGRIVTVEDPENLMEHKDFIQRMRVRAGASDATQSRPIDLNSVSARLQEIHETHPRSPSLSSTESIDDEEYERHLLVQDTESYNALINEGGRPSHPIGFPYSTTRDPGEYHDILSFWNESPNLDTPEQWKVFGGQLGTWRRFRERQRFVREQGRFLAYYQQVQARLQRHGFKKSFQLDEDLDRQDKLATWIEYLNYEYRFYDGRTNIIRRWQSTHDKAWQKLIDSNILRHKETEESIWGFGIGVELQHEEMEAGVAVGSATSNVKSAEKVIPKAKSAGLCGESISQLEQKLSLARAKLAAATRSLELATKRRSLLIEFHNQTMPYRRAKEDASHQRILLRWMLRQVPLIEIELEAAKTTKHDSTRRTGGRKLKRNRADDPIGEPVSKRRRRSSDSHLSAAPETSSTRQTRSSCANFDAKSVNPRSQRPAYAAKASVPRTDPKKSSAVPGDSVPVRKGTRCGRRSFGCTPDSRVLRRTPRPRRAPERFR